MKIAKLSRRALFVILLLAVLIPASIAVAYLYYDWSLTLTEATPDVRFYKWSDESQYNTLDLSYNIYADMWLKDDNATHGIKNNGASDVTTYIWFESITNQEYVQNVTVWVLNETATELCSITTDGTSNLGEGNAQSWNADVSGTTNIDTLKIWIQGNSTVGSVTVSLGLKTQE